MNFHLELRRRSCRQIIKRYGDRQLRILKVRQHQLTVGRRPECAPCSIRYYPAIGRMLKVQTGDMNAIRMWNEMQKEGSAGVAEVTIVDSI